MDDETAIQALEREKAGYEATGRKDRAKAVDAEISRIKGGSPRTTSRSKGGSRTATPAGPDEDE